MPSQTLLIALLGMLVFLLSGLLIYRISKERKLLSALRRMDIDAFADFLKTNEIDGTIQLVASRVSEFLKSVFECQRIVFLRKQRGTLELNYYYGIRGFRRSEFSTPFSAELIALLQESTLPRSIDDITGLLSEGCLAKLRQSRLELFFPVFWRDNLYGVYFVKAPPQARSASFQLLVASLAHSLSAAYHIKWHESRYSRLEHKLRRSPNRSEIPRSDPQSSFPILKLIGHRNSRSIVPRIVQTVRDELSLDKVIYVYESPKKADGLLVCGNGLSGAVGNPKRTVFDELCAEIQVGQSADLDRLAGNGGASGEWSKKLQESGLSHLTQYRLSGSRTGLMAWSCSKSAPTRTGQRLATWSMHSGELIENAESYERVEELSYTDSLTGLANQRYFLKRLGEEIDRAKRYNRSMALIIFDLDELKSINDKYGHLAGDAVLKRLGQILKNSIRAIDIIARYGGDEFCVIMPEADRATCQRFMERLREKISGASFSVDASGNEYRCTISQGGAVYPEHGEIAEELIRSADQALLTAKGRGRDQAVLAENSGATSGQ